MIQYAFLQRHAAERVQQLRLEADTHRALTKDRAPARIPRIMAARKRPAAPADAPA
jgi:hypothetical protein